VFHPLFGIHARALVVPCIDLWFALYVVDSKGVGATEVYNTLPGKTGAFQKQSQTAFKRIYFSWKSSPATKKWPET
jgi:hypothetical protein